jgi:hypothetical protein
MLAASRGREYFAIYVRSSKVCHTSYSSLLTHRASNLHVSSGCQGTDVGVHVFHKFSSHHADDVKLWGKLAATKNTYGLLEASNSIFFPKIKTGNLSTRSCAVSRIRLNKYRCS